MRPAEFTETVREVGVVLLRGVTESQVPLAVDAAARKPIDAPELAMLRVWVAGAVPPIV